MGGILRRPIAPLAVCAGGALLAGVDIAARWRELVRTGMIAATVGGMEEEEVRYGVRLRRDGSFEEFVIGCEALNKTLATGDSQRRVYDGGFVATLQLVRTLRPPPTPGLADMPPYDPSTDSFVTGPLRLQIRPRAARLHVAGTGRSWDCFHNISPCDVRGHFLLLPTIDDKRNWRKQALTEEDCADLVWLARSTVAASEHSPPWLLNYNSVRAGASQNHIHCHAWPNPPLPLEAASRPYAVTEAAVRADTPPLLLAGGVELALLDYPCAVVRLRGGDAAAAGAALAGIVRVVEALGCPSNVVALGDEAWAFVRSPTGERAPKLPSHKLGASEMMGHFHCASAEQLSLCAGPGFMAEALSSVSADAAGVWGAIRQALA